MKSESKKTFGMLRDIISPSSTQTMTLTTGLNVLKAWNSNRNEAFDAQRVST